MIDPLMTSESRLVAIKRDAVLARPGRAYSVVGVAVGRVEVEDEEQVCALEDYHAVGLVLREGEWMLAGGKDAESRGEMRKQTLTSCLSL